VRRGESIVGVTRGVYEWGVTISLHNVAAGVHGGDPKEGVSGRGRGLKGRGVLPLGARMSEVNVGDERVGVSGSGSNCALLSPSFSTSWIMDVSGGE
jgi:hypothetical protein